MILYVIRLASRFDNYVSFLLEHHSNALNPSPSPNPNPHPHQVSFLLQYDSNTHDSVRGKPYRQLAISAAVRAQLTSAQAALRRVLLGELRSLLLGWYHKLSRELDEAFECEDEEVHLPCKS